jgi:hypothetical protein
MESRRRGDVRTLHHPHFPVLTFYHVLACTDSSLLPFTQILTIPLLPLPVRVHSKPEFLVPPFTTFDLIEGQDESINVTTKGNPSEITFKWSRQNGLFDLKRVRTNGSTLSFMSVSRSDAGILNIAATNAEGLSETQIRLNVKCKHVYCC